MRLIFAVFAACFVARTFSEGGDKDASFKADSRLSYGPEYAVYHSMDDVLVHTRILLGNHPHRIAVARQHTSAEGRPIHVLNVTDHAAPGPKVRLLLVCGEHAREFVPVESCFHLLHRLLQVRPNGGVGVADGHADGAFVAWVLRHAELYVIPMLNPDGRRKLEVTQDYCWRAGGNGADVERNFEWNFDGPGSSSNPKSEEYHGPRAFSEPESRVIKSLAEEVELDGALIVHSGSRQLFVPFADTKSKLTRRHFEHLQESLELVQSVNTACDGFFEGPNGETWAINEYTADGTMMDFLAGVKRVRLPLSVEIYGVMEDLPHCFVQFNPPARSLEAVLARSAPMYDAFVSFIIERRLRATFDANAAQSSPGAGPASSARSIGVADASAEGASASLRALRDRALESIRRLDFRIDRVLARMSAAEGELEAG